MFLRTLGVPIEIHEAWKKGGESRNNLIKLLAEANFNKDSLMISSWIIFTLNHAKIFTFRNWDILNSPNWLKKTAPSIVVRTYHSVIGHVGFSCLRSRSLFFSSGGFSPLKLWITGVNLSRDNGTLQSKV